ncbi:MAG: aminoacyl-tRNA hydrolase [Hyphomicrobiaceae bacterium]|nr:aminoacyl-tRNA hydrolase [Hyphomicrobiaceae bacterium]
MKLFVGLGNPGSEYAGNRHNVGFMAVDAIAERHGFGPWKKKFQGLASDGEIASERILLLKPQTYMNESGRSVGEAARFLKVALADIVVFYDEIDLAPGKLKAKIGGGNAGHNGLRSITAHLGNDYQRVRIGVGHPGQKHLVANYVLSNFAKAEQNWLAPLLDAIAGAAPKLARGDQARFLTDVAKELQIEGSSEVGSAPVVSGPSAQPRQRGHLPPRHEGKIASAEPSRSSPRHPAGERDAKRKGALADNLKKWLASRKSED